MLFEAKTISLKNGKTALFRAPELLDAAILLNYIKQASGETDFLLRYPEEWDSTTLQEEESWVNRLRDSPDILDINCFVDEKLVGNCEIDFFSNKKGAPRQHWHCRIGGLLGSRHRFGHV